MAAASPLVAGIGDPTYRVVTKFPALPHPGMPGLYPGRVVRVHAESSYDPAAHKANRPVVKQMIATGMRSLTGDQRAEDAWARFITPADVVGVKVNCSGAPDICSDPAIVAEIVDCLIAVGVPARQIYIYERFMDQMKTVNFPAYVAAGVHIAAAEDGHGTILGYDPHTYVETSFFGEDDTRSYLTKMVAETFTKIVNVPVAKEHQAAGVTGCLKNIAYGNFSNVARSHRNEKTNTYSFIGTLAAVEPVRSRVVLNIMDGLKGVWHAGPFSYDPKFRFYPKELMIGTDPVAMDHKLIELIEAKRRQEGAVSIFDRSKEHLGNNRDKNLNAFIREPGHVEYASKLGLGVFENARIDLREIQL